MGGGTGANALYSPYPQLVSKPKGKAIHNIIQDRLRQFTGGGQYQNQSLLPKLDEGRASGGDAVRISVYSPPNLARPSFDEAVKKGVFDQTKKGQSFGPSWSTHWFKITIRVPSDLAEKEHLEFHWDANNEGLVWSEKGEPLQGLTGGGDRVEWIFPTSWRDGSPHTFYIEMACNGMFGNAPGGDGNQPPDPNKYFQLNTADIVAVNLEARQLFVDFWIIGDAARELPQDSWQEHQALQICNDIMDAFIAGEGSQESILKGREIASKYLGDINSHKVYESGKEAIVFAVGHCHIDTCWLWPWAETKRKVARSWANQCDLMDRYPEHRFVCSQAQQYKWLKQLYPALWKRVSEKVHKGTFIPIGGSWVEHDTNLPSGESLVRQFLYGQRFFESNFGERSKTFWLPDTFGYSSQLPQLCRLAGMSRFLTQKLSWNNINKFPHTTFNWVSLDGSQVLCHMPPSETYTAEAHFGDVRRSESQHKSLDQDNTSLLVFGKGDGGGGPTFQMLEKLRRCRGISDQVGLLPRVKVGNTVDEFFYNLEKKVANGTEFTTWYGELYFELHRGTYTTQSNNKWNNRKLEILMRDIEFMATLASLKPKSNNESKSYSYPKKDIDDMWEGILLCQFHDCLPGSSIEMCYRDSDKLYAGVWTTGKRLIKEALEVLGFEENEDEGRHMLNLLPWKRHDISQPTTAFSARLGPIPLITDSPGGRDLKLVEHQDGSIVVSNEQFQIKVENGTITSLKDIRSSRELVPKGEKANQFVIFDDKPLFWQAWDVEVYHLNSRKEIKSGKTVVIKNDYNGISLFTETKISDKSWIKSTITMRSALYNDYPYIEFDTAIEWQETMKFLKVEFPVNIVNTEASYETQYGIVRRPTHYNTDWDMAKFEVCCHKWADLSEYGYGVSILNDSKYGFATSGKTMRLSLLRSSKAPDGHADMGLYRMQFLYVR